MEPSTSLDWRKTSARYLVPQAARGGTAGAADRALHPHGTEAFQRPAILQGYPLHDRGPRACSWRIVTPTKEALELGAASVPPPNK